MYGLYLILLVLDCYPDFEGIKHQVLELEMSEALDQAVSTVFYWYRPMLAKHMIEDFEAMKYDISNNVDRSADITNTTTTFVGGQTFEPKCQTISFRKVSSAG